MDTTQRFKLNFDVDRAPKATRIKELHEHIQKLEEVAQKKTNSRIEKGSSSTPEQTNIGQKTNPAEEDDEEPEAAPLLHKRKRSIPTRRVMTLPGSNRRIHSGSSTPASDSQTDLPRLYIIKWWYCPQSRRG